MSARQKTFSQEVKLEGLGLQLVGNTPAEMTEIIKTETPAWGKVIKDAGIKMPQ